MRVLRIGMKGQDIKKWQLFLIGQGFLRDIADGIFGDNTFKATVEFQEKYKLDPDGVVGHQSILKAVQLGYVILDDVEDNSTTGPNWPPKPDFPPLTGTAARQAVFGKFAYRHEPLPDNYENIRILGNWETDNIVPVAIPQINGIKGAPRSCSVQFHRLAAEQLKSLWKAWEQEGLLGRVLTYEGSFSPRFIRGSTTVLSNHAFGTAFDINYSWNNLGSQPALVGAKGSVRELVPIANEHGFCWGGHFDKRQDGMHFEVAVSK